MEDKYLIPHKASSQRCSSLGLFCFVLFFLLLSWFHCICLHLFVVFFLSCLPELWLPILFRECFDFFFFRKILWCFSWSPEKNCSIFSYKVDRTSSFWQLIEEFSSILKRVEIIFSFMYVCKYWGSDSYLIILSVFLWSLTARKCVEFVELYLLN